MALNYSWFVVSDCLETGHLKADYCVLKRLEFFNKMCDLKSCYLFTCSCKDSAIQSTRLMCTSSLLLEDCATFKLREEKQYCIHRKMLPQLHCDKFPILKPCSGDTEDDTLESSDPVAILSLNPLCIAVLSGEQSTLHSCIYHYSLYFVQLEKMFNLLE